MQPPRRVQFAARLLQPIPHMALKAMLSKRVIKSQAGDKSRLATPTTRKGSVQADPFRSQYSHKKNVGGYPPTNTRLPPDYLGLMAMVAEAPMAVRHRLGIKH